MLTVEFDGDGFLYKMVRLMVGSLMECAVGKRSISDLTDWLGASGAGKRVWLRRHKVYIWSGSIISCGALVGQGRLGGSDWQRTCL